MINSVCVSHELDVASMAYRHEGIVEFDLNTEAELRHAGTATRSGRRSGTEEGATGNAAGSDDGAAGRSKAGAAMASSSFNNSASSVVSPESSADTSRSISS